MRQTGGSCPESSVWFFVGAACQRRCVMSAGKPWAGDSCCISGGRMSAGRGCWA